MYTAEASVIVNADQQTTWNYVSNYENFDRIMSNVTKVKMLDSKTSEWEMSGPLGIPVKWKAMTSTEQSPSHLAWHSLEGSLETKGFIKIEPVSEGSRVTVHVEYTPPLGAIGEAVASLMKDPQKMLEHDLERLGELIQGAPVDAAGKRETRAMDAAESHNLKDVSLSSDMHNSGSSR
jgi:uncharacterized membrane protein